MTASGARSNNRVARSPPRAAVRNVVDDAVGLGARGLRRHGLRHALHLASRPARQLAHRSTRAPHDSTDLVEPVTEDIVQDERGSFGRHQRVEDDLHRVAHPVGQQRVGFRVYRCGVGGCLGLGHRSGTSLAQLVKAQPRDDGRQPGRQVLDVVGPGEPKPGLLQHVVRIGLRPEYPDGKRSQPGPLGIEVGHFHRGHIILTWAALGM